MEEGTLAAAIECFARHGYSGAFRAVDAGLCDVRSGRVYRPEQLQIDELARFEGMSDPDEQVAAFALSDASGKKRGVYVVAFGPSIDRLDAATVRRLRDARFSGAGATA